MGRLVKQQHQPSTLHGHVRELLKRLFVIFLVLLVAGIVIYSYYEPVLAFLGAPLKAPLYYSNPAGGFSFVMKICLMGGFIFTIPVIIYNVIMFVRPAFSKFVSIKKILTTTGLSTILAVAGAAFAFYCIVPQSLAFFKGYQVSGLSALISADSYLNFITGIMTMFAMIFQIPLLISFIDHIKPFNTGRLLKADKYVIVGSLIITLLQPFTFDLLTSLFIAGSIIGIYNLGIVAVVFQHANEKRRVRNAIHARIATPKVLSEFCLDSSLLNDIVPEFTQPVLPTVAIEKPQITKPVIAQHRVSMDIKTPVKVVPPEIVTRPVVLANNREVRRLIVQQRRRPVFSDVVRTHRIAAA